jgi:hypothetical protein
MDNIATTQPGQSDENETRAQDETYNVLALAQCSGSSVDVLNGERQLRLEPFVLLHLPATTKRREGNQTRQSTWKQSQSSCALANERLNALHVCSVFPVQGRLILLEIVDLNSSQAMAATERREFSCMRRQTSALIRGSTCFCNASRTARSSSSACCVRQRTFVRGKFALLERRQEQQPAECGRSCCGHLHTAQLHSSRAAQRQQA